MIIRNGLQEIRKRRGVSAADLARLVGFTRQTIYAIEDGTFVPNTAVSLQLSRALDVKVEEIFSISDEQAPKSISADLLSTVPVQEGQPVRVCRVNQRFVAVPATFLPAYLPPADAIVESRKKLSVRTKSPVEMPENGTRLLLAGCDPALCLLRAAWRFSG